MTKVTILGQEEPKQSKKLEGTPIRFNSCLASSGEKITSTKDAAARDWDGIELITRNYTTRGEDLMFAFKGDDRNDHMMTCLFIGYFNDGVVE